MRQGRMERLAREFQQEIARILQREIKDPRLGFVTVTRVTLSPDGSHAKVFYSSLGTPQQQQQGDQAALERSAAYIYSLIKKRFRLKLIPALTFEYDPSIAGSIAVDETLDRLREPPQG